MATEIAEIVDLERAHGRAVLVAGLERALAFRRFRAVDARDPRRGPGHTQGA